MVIRTAAQIVRDAGVPPGSLAAARAIFAWVRDRIAFERDPHGIEQLSWPHRTLEKGHEDCDGKITLFAALVRAAGIPVAMSFKAIGTNPLLPWVYEHVYGVLHVAGANVPVDPTYPRTPWGWQHPRATCAMEVAL